MMVCACDPDCSTPAFALFSDKKLVHWELLKTGKGGRIEKALSDIKAIIDMWRPELLVIENQYLPPGLEGVRRFRSVSRLVAARAMITAVFAISHIEYQIIEPFTWQRTLGGSRLGRDQLKNRSMLKASDIAGQAIEDHNLADAINLGYWFVTSNRIGKANERPR